MLETSNKVRKYTHTHVFKALLILLMSAFFAKNQRFLSKIVSLLKAIMKYKFSRLYVRNPASTSLKIGDELKNGNDVTIFWHDIIVKFFWRCFIFFVNFSY